MNKLYHLLFLLMISLGVMAQPTFNISDREGNSGETVVFDFTVEDFTDIVGLQFSVNWDPNVLSFSEVQNISTNLPDLNTGAFNTDNKFTDQGQMVISWFDNNINSNSLADGARLFSLAFVVVGAEGATTNVTITGTPRAIEVISPELENLGLEVMGGSFRVSGGTGVEQLRLIAGDQSAQNGSEVCVPISVEKFTNIASIQLSMNWDENALEFKGLKGLNLPGLTDGAFNLDDVQDGLLRLSWLEPSSSGIDVDDGTTIFEVCFTAQAVGSSVVGFSDDPLPIEIIDGNDNRVSFTKKDANVTITSTGGGGGDCDVAGFAIAATDVNANPNEEVCVDIFVKGFNEILSLSSTISWDENVLSNPRVQDFGLNGLVAGNFNLDQGASGLASFVWIDPDVEGVTVGDNTVIFRLCFDVIGANGQSTAISFGDDITNREVSDPNGAIDFNQCDGTFTVGTGGGGPSVSASTTNPSCPGDGDGSINITVSNVDLEYTVSWFDDAGILISTNEDLQNLAAGTYTVEIRDETTNELIVSDDVVLSDPAAINISFSKVDPTEGNSDGSVDVTVNGGTPPYTYAWSSGQTAQDLSNIAAGTYKLTVTDANNCEMVSDDINVGTTGGSLSLNVNAVDFNGFGTPCNGECSGEATVSITGGSEPYDISWSNGQSGQTVTGLCAGDYSVSVTDADGATGEASITITEPQDLVVDFEVTDSENDNGTIRARVSGGTQPYSYLWNDKEPPSTVAFITMLPEGRYTLIVTDDNDCILRGDVTVRGGNPCFSTALNAITPNNDSRNDQLIISCAEGTENELEIFNRWGEMVYKTDNYNNDWEGTDASGEELPDGGYYYIFKVRESGELQQYKGHVTIVRRLF